jgi:hypothetical protein
VATLSPQCRPPFVDTATAHANNPTVTSRTPCRATYTGRFRRGVVALSLIAWTLSSFACPMPDHGKDFANPHGTALAAGNHTHHHAHASNRSSPDLCCQLLSDSHAIVKDIVAPTAPKAPTSSNYLASAQTVPLGDTADQQAQVTPRSDGPPQNLYQRFATFWAHAPPADHS